MNDISYSKFISGLEKAGIEINRKMLAELAVSDEKAFTNLVKLANDGLNGKVKKTETKEVKAEVKKEEKVEKKAATKATAAKKAPAKKATTTKKTTKSAK